MKYRTIDLCAGIGGIRRGFEMTNGFENVLSAEIDESACQTYKHLFKENPFNDLTSEEFKEKVVETDYDVLLAGFPCQAFSRAGLQLGFRDTTKGTIFFDIADIISRTNPKAVFLENVENLVSHDKKNTIKTIIKTLEDELGYRIIGVSIDDKGEYVYSRQSFVRNSRYFGLPQNRPRVYIMAFSKAVYGEAVKVLTEGLPTEGHSVSKSLNEILETNVDDRYYMSSKYLATLEAHKAREHDKGHGFGYCVVNRDGVNNPVANTIMATGGSGKERNLVCQFKEGVANKEIPGKHSKLNDKDIRVMTPTEWGRLQGFIDYAFIDDDGVDHFSFPEGISKTQQYKQFGNSVTIPVIEQMALYMLKCFEEMEKARPDIIYNLAKTKGEISRHDVIDCLKLEPIAATTLLKEMVSEGKLVKIGQKRGTKYRIPQIEANVEN